MRALPCFDVGLRMIFAAIALGCVAGACGSITVIPPDGGEVPSDVRSGDGGASGGGQGGKADAGAGHDGGAIGGRTGGGGLGGANGSLGGVSGGSGGKLGGQGGATGGGGTMGGVGGSGMVSCPQLQRDFAVALADAKGCTLGAVGQCMRQTTDRLDCGCPTYVTSTAKIDLVRQAWSQNGCSTGICPAVLCTVSSGAVCTLPPQSTASVCVDQSGPSPLP